MKIKEWVNQGKPLNSFINGDCMEGMKHFPDKYFELAIVDPPYGIGSHKFGNGRRKGRQLNYKMKPFDNERPAREYFVELRRISCNQIIWGGNYFADKLAVSKGWIFWDKMQPENISFAKGELAWTSFDIPLRKYKIRYSGPAGQNPLYSYRVHPTQKPIELYKGLLKNYARQSDKILDTHVGSASSLIACIDLGFDYIGFELDKDYYDAATERIKRFQTQKKLAL